MKNQQTITKRNKIVLIGGMGTIGRILQAGLKNAYHLCVLDVQEPLEINEIDYVKADVSNVDQLTGAIPEDAYALVNVVGIPDHPPVPDADAVRRLSDIYIVGSYNVLLAAAVKGIRRVVFASTNHVTGDYEVNGISSLDREIRTTDYPLPDSAYGAMKLCAELFGYLFFKEKKLSVISLRLGGVKEDELACLRLNARSQRTIMSKEDTVEIFRRAIETDVKYGVYYAVSDNPGKPWDLSSTIRDLGYRPRVNSQQLLEEYNEDAKSYP